MKPIVRNLMLVAAGWACCFVGIPQYCSAEERASSPKHTIVFPYSYALIYTNVVPLDRVSTNLPKGLGTNVFVYVSLGRQTNVSVVIKSLSKDGKALVITTQFVSPDQISKHKPDQIMFNPPLGDFWKPGEYEKMLEEKRQQRKQKKDE